VNYREKEKSRDGQQAKGYKGKSKDVRIPLVLALLTYRSTTYVESIVSGVSSLSSWVSGTQQLPGEEKDIVQVALFKTIEVVPNIRYNSEAFLIL
jgi:hypothetical protein